MATSLFDLNHFGLKYGDKPIFSDISISIPKLQTTAIIGPSGCGKSSFLSCLNQLVRAQKASQLTGNLQWKGKPIHEVQRDRRSYRRQVGTLFQQPNPFPTTIKKNLLIPLKEHFKLSVEEQDSRVEEVLDRVGLWHEVKDRLHLSALELSGGQKQRLCLARALILDPEVLLMDEPCSALDPISTEAVENLIKSFKDKITTVIVTHNMQQAKRIAENVIVFWYQTHQGGYVVEHGPCEEIFTNPQKAITQRYIQGAWG